MEIKLRAMRRDSWLHLLPVPYRATRQGEGHISVRFKDRFFRVFLNEVDVSSDCVEALAGEPGWVILVERPIREPLRYGLRYGLQHGTVRIERREEMGAPT